MTIKALIFDQDGVIIDTERDGHRVAFNQCFKEFGFDFEWDVDTYYELLQVAGGKERMRHYHDTVGFGVEVPAEGLDDLIRAMHKRKTSIFIELIESGALPLRPGVKRLMREANAAGIVVGVCTTSDVRAANAVAYGINKDITFDFVFAGDVVKKKKPDPAIYLLALQHTGFNPEECVVVEDSRNGLLAARAAHMNVVCTTNGYTASEDLSQADIIVTCLGDQGVETGQLVMGEVPGYDGVLTLAQLMDLFG